ncbi:hypothetical protein [Virgisporangium aurantiacum]|uniref:Uncharacterized protein n=1 Tax=Virgisporangium aurantiacum TaxID=175570 RepID=A0A8J4E7B3_9ACTN|nr:hypothetical protein [Virgisporangium aurantiacum]GIJ64361.1 hypothetical protein Vau01_118770 [Virgisporangium aurantiacum]
MFEPSTQIASILTAIASNPNAGAGMRLTQQRESEFASPVQAQLAGIAADPQDRTVADRVLDASWSDAAGQLALLRATGTDREVIIGSGFHAAVYCAVRVLSGYPKPLVLERGPRIGGAFAVTDWPTFYLNSRNRRGSAGLAGDHGASLNYLPGAPIQAANLSMSEYQTNTDMAFLIRLTLAQFADVVSNARVVSVIGTGAAVQIEITDRDPLFAGRVIDARGLGDPSGQDVANGSTILTFDQFMRRMAGVWPLRGLRRVAVIGGGDSAKCAVESLLGIAPQPPMATAALDSVDRIDWYSYEVPITCKQWRRESRGRYQAIGRYLRPDRMGVRRLTVIGARPQPIALPGLGLIEGRTYDLVIVCTGNRETTIDGLAFDSFTEYGTPDRTVVARKHENMPVFRIGPHARLPFTPQERVSGIANIPANAVAMFRTATKTAALAATLPAVTQG